MSGLDVVDSVQYDISTPEGREMKERYTEYLRARKESNLPEMDFNEYLKRYPTTSNAEVALADAQPM